MAKWREDPCVKLPVLAREIGSMHEKIDCRLREKERGEELPEHRGSSSIDAKLELEIVAQEAERGFEGSTEGTSREKEKQGARVSWSRTNARDRRFSRSFEFSSIKLTAFRWLASLRPGV
ncbi:unnamed protein product [Lasius platythorax]|uniref:Uncharacterized protein n=1 Tax=Lasius platythorax TaxID=488582 RepID=A0AAV2P828_9HYME